ncbi:GTP-binding protein [Acidianus hospitalis]|uniref:Tr-type G domain-containing protein n=1 Tax=Acidianus hospitalis (strain W1) TaxID=933801 RepID=F4B5K4_ACIHW|nr:GTP-binding protein [Acidianus hospitalis]AEE94428.1 conserved hypothetical protein [Acidianus hospitalis W1]
MKKIIINIEGSVNSGKSTLLGYLLWKYSTNKDYIAQKTRLFQIYNKQYKVPVQEYLANLVQITSDETIRQMTSKSHAVNITIGDLQLIAIDIGGHNRYTYQAHLSTVESDTTLFAIPVDEIKEKAYLKNTMLTHLITTYLVRKAFGRTPEFHVIITKIDMEKDYDKYVSQVKSDLDRIGKILGMTDARFYYYTSSIIVKGINDIQAEGQYEELLKNLESTVQTRINSSKTVFHARDVMNPTENIKVLAGRVMSGKIQKNDVLNTPYGEQKVIQIEEFGQKIYAADPASYIAIRFERDNFPLNFKGGEVLGNFEYFSSGEITLLDLRDTVKRIQEEFELKDEQYYNPPSKIQKGTKFYTTINGYRTALKVEDVISEESKKLRLKVKIEDRVDKISVFGEIRNTGITYEENNKIWGAFIL